MNQPARLALISLGLVLSACASLGGEPTSSEHARGGASAAARASHAASTGDQLWSRAEALPAGDPVAALPEGFEEPLGLYSLGGELVVEGSKAVLVIDPASGDVSERIPLPDVPQINALLLTTDSLWVTDHDSGAVVRVDRTTGDELARVELPYGRAVSLVEANGEVWAGGGHVSPEFVMAIDASANEPGTIIEEGAWPTSDGESLWFGRDAYHAFPTVREVDPTTGSVVRTIDLAGAEGCYVGGAIPDVMWSWCFDPPPDETVAARLDASLGHVVAEVDLGASGGLVGTTASSSWFFSDLPGGVVVVEVSNATNEPIGVWSLTPALAWTLYETDLWTLDLESGELRKLALEDITAIAGG